jgi:glycosyltransferase involved in cell wall biosynthesis
MHISDTLEAGGAEMVAVNMVNVLPRERYRAHLCTTRRDGPLSELVADDVRRLCLARRWRYSAAALRRLVNYIREHQIRILHAHGSSLFIAAAASLFPPHPMIVWHDHFGRYAVEGRPEWLYRQAARRVAGVIAVSTTLAEWSRQQLRLPSNRVWYVPNFVQDAKADGVRVELPGDAGARIVCVANFRPQKDHPNLLRAVRIVVRQLPEVHVLLVGNTNEGAYFDFVREEIARQGLERNVSILGPRRDVSAILRACDIGVLSSASEGLPLALIEYGAASLPSVATQVGQCAEVLDDGRAGLLVPPSAPEQLAGALLSLLRSPERRAVLAENFHHRVREVYGPAPVVQQVCRIYETVLSSRQCAK